MPSALMKHEIDPATELWNKIGDLSHIDVFNSEVLLAIYQRPEKTRGGIIMTAQSRDEDIYQGKSGLVVKKGPLAFQSTESVDFAGQDVEVGQWIAIRPTDGWAIKVNGVECRLVTDVNIKLRIPAPDMVY